PEVFLPDNNQTGHSDTRAYQGSAFNRFVSPISSTGGCANNYIIFIGNNGQAQPNSDDANLITGVGGSSTQLQRPDVTVGTVYTDVGFSDTCSAKPSTTVSPWTVA